MDAGSPIPIMMSSAPDILVLFTLYHFSGCADICFVFGWLRLLRGGAGQSACPASPPLSPPPSLLLLQSSLLLRNSSSRAGK